MNRYLTIEQVVSLINKNQADAKLSQPLIEELVINNIIEPYFHSSLVGHIFKLYEFFVDSLFKSELSELEEKITELNKLRSTDPGNEFLSNEIDNTLLHKSQLEEAFEESQSARNHIINNDFFQLCKIDNRSYYLTERKTGLVKIISIFVPSMITRVNNCSDSTLYERVLGQKEIELYPMHLEEELLLDINDIHIKKEDMDLIYEIIKYRVNNESVMTPPSGTEHKEDRDSKRVKTLLTQLGLISQEHVKSAQFRIGNTNRLNVSHLAQTMEKKLWVEEGNGHSKASIEKNLKDAKKEYQKLLEQVENLKKS